MQLSPQALSAIKQLISQGNLEEAYEQLVKLLDAYAHYAELAHIARVNQADLYQLKAQTLKGIIPPDDARLTTNQLTDKALQLIRQLETGKAAFEEDIKPTSSKAWRYYLAGGIVALTAAILVWKLLGGKQDDCPQFSETAELKVLILPFKQTGKTKEAEPEFDIMDGLNDLIEKTPGLRVKALADVHKNFDIEADYPNSARAVEIARNCNAQMLVWGKVQQSTGKEYILDVRYRLLDAGGVRYAGDTTISNLLAVTKEASWTHDVKAVTRLLYMVLANQMQVHLAANILAELDPIVDPKMNGDVQETVDTATSLVLADYYIQENETDKAIAQYDKVLSQDPNHSLALTKRGALLLKKKDYSGAARDLEAAQSVNPQSTTPDLLKARVEAFLKSGQPEKARVEIETLRPGAADGTWLENKTQEITDSTKALTERRDVMERMAAKRPENVKLRVDAAKANLGLGDNTKALKYATQVLKNAPDNTKAVEVAAEAHLHNGDTAKAVETIKAAERAGVNVKTIKLPPIRQLALPQKQE